MRATSDFVEQSLGLGEALARGLRQLRHDTVDRVVQFLGGHRLGDQAELCGAKAVEGLASNT